MCPCASMYMCVYVDMFANEGKLVWGKYMCVNEFVCALMCVCHASVCMHVPMHT